MMKWLFLGAIFFFWFLAPVLFRAMARHDYDQLYNGIQSSKRSAQAGAGPRLGSD